MRTAILTVVRGVNWSGDYLNIQFLCPSPHIVTHTAGLADCNSKVISFSRTALQRHSFLFRLFLVLLHLLNTTQWKQITNQQAYQLQTFNRAPQTQSPACHSSLPCTSSWVLRSSCGEPRSSCPALHPSHDPFWASCHWASGRRHVTSLINWIFSILGQIHLYFCDTWFSLNTRYCLHTSKVGFSDQRTNGLKMSPP